MKRKERYCSDDHSERVVIAEQIGTMILVLDPHNRGIDVQAEYLLKMDRGTFDNLFPGMTKEKFRECASVFTKIAKGWKP